jgi:Icc-related predicted phosphoesterase
MIRIAAVGDIHVRERGGGSLRPSFLALAGRADVLLLAGDLTHVRTIAQAELLAAELRDVPVPVIAVLGNHDFHADESDGIRRTLERAGAIMLEGETVTLTFGGRTLGIAGVKGFGGGFRGSHGHKFGEREMKAFVQAADDEARRLDESLRTLHTDHRVALLHYAPIPATVEGERLEIFPFLGAYQLGEALDRAGADLALHGHAHHGAEKGTTPAGIPVRNVAMPLIRQPYALFVLGAAGEASASPQYEVVPPVAQQWRR